MTDTVETDEQTDVTDDDGNAVVVGVYTSFVNDGRQTISVGTCDPDDTDSEAFPTIVLTLIPVMAVQLARELMAAVAYTMTP